MNVSSLKYTFSSVRVLYILFHSSSTAVTEKHSLKELQSQCLTLNKFIIKKNSFWHAFIKCMYLIISEWKFPSCRKIKPAAAHLRQGNTWQAIIGSKCLTGNWKISVSKVTRTKRPRESKRLICSTSQAWRRPAMTNCHLPQRLDVSMTTRGVLQRVGERGRHKCTPHSWSG